MEYADNSIRITFSLMKQLGLVWVSFITTTKKSFTFNFICIKQSIMISGFHHSVRFALSLGFYTSQNPKRIHISNNPSLLLIMNLPHFRLIFTYLLICCINELIWKSVVSSPKNKMYPLPTVQLLHSHIHQDSITITKA